MQKISSILLLTTSIYASQFSINPSFQGYTGVINTPNAQVTKEAHATLSVNNQFDNFLRSYDYSNDVSEENYVLGFGLFSFMEVQGRLSEAPGYHRDLSVNVKMQLPYHNEYLPDIAIGAQDLGGAANHYDNYYAVIDKELWFLRASLGYGYSSNEYERIRMDGLFGAVEVRVQEWLYLMAEDDSHERHAALRVEMPKSWMSAFNARATTAYNITSSEVSFGVTLDIPLWHTSKTETLKYQSESKSIQTTPTEQTQVQTSATNQVKKDKHISSKETKSSIEKRLVAFGFENVSVGTKEETLYVQAENSIFDHNDLDAIGYIAGVLSYSDLAYKNFSITLLKNNLKIMTLKGDSEVFKEYVKSPSIVNERRLASSLRFSREFKDEDVSFSESKNSSLFIPRVELSLGLLTGVGTEVGAFDYAASMRVKGYVNLYDGLLASVLYETPIASSDDFQEGGAFYDRYETNLQSRVVNAMLHQTLRYDNLLNTVSVGKYETDYLGVINQADFTTSSGENAFRYVGGYFVEESDTSKDKYFSLGSYKYTYAPLDSSVELSYGKFWYGDVGTQLKLKRFFGETSVAFNYKNTSLNGIGEEFAGIQISFPMTTRKLYPSNYVQIKGKKDFTYNLRTTINKDDGTNTINHNYGRVPESDFGISSFYLNRDRLSESYIKEHLDRLRDAYLTYSK